MGKILKLCVSAFIGLILILQLVLPVLSNPATVIHKRRSTDEQPKQACSKSTPCGWAVYAPLTRQVDFFMKNTCECSSKTQCIRTDDDLSVSAYVYRCRANKKGDSS